MGRPKKKPDQVKDTSPEGTADDPGSEAPPVKVFETFPELKPCPSCGGKAEVKLDAHGLNRCFCQACGFWDCAAFETELEAAKSWNAAGGPNPVE